VDGSRGQLQEPERLQHGASGNPKNLPSASLGVLCVKPARVRSTHCKAVERGDHRHHLDGGKTREEVCRGSGVAQPVAPRRRCSRL